MAYTAAPYLSVFAIMMQTAITKASIPVHSHPKSTWTISLTHLQEGFIHRL